MVVGTIIGSGIFRVPGVVAAEAGTALGIGAVWVLGGLVMLCGSLALAELAAAFPRSGGVFVYLREIYGPGVAFLYGWTLLVVAPAGAAGIALVFAEYLGRLVPLSPFAIRMVAAGAIIVVAAAGYRSVRGAGAIQSAAAAAKVGGLLALVVAGFLLGDGQAGAFGTGASRTATSWAGAGVGLVAALWAYNGFQDMVSISGEVRDPSRVLPRGLIAGAAIIIAIYLAANAAYLYVLPFSTLQGSPLVAADVAVAVLGPGGAAVVSAMVMVSTFGALNGMVLVNPRVFYAMAEDRLLFAPLARVHPRFATPHVAVASYAAVALVFVFSRSFEQLAEAFVLGVFPFLALSCVGVLVLRRQQPGLRRPYRMPGSWPVPALFVAATLWVFWSALSVRPGSTIAGILFTLLGIPVYLWQRRH